MKYHAKKQSFFLGLVRTALNASTQPRSPHQRGYLTLVLNSKLTQLQAERDAGGSIIQHWKPSEIAEVLIPIVNIETQTQIAALIQESFALKAESEKLLAKAKQAVEIAIEEGEDKAMAWVK